MGPSAWERSSALGGEGIKNAGGEIRTRVSPVTMTDMSMARPHHQAEDIVFIFTTSQPSITIGVVRAAFSLQTGYLPTTRPSDDFPHPAGSSGGPILDPPPVGGIAISHRWAIISISFRNTRYALRGHTRVSLVQMGPQISRQGLHQECGRSLRWENRSPVIKKSTGIMVILSEHSGPTWS